MRSVNMIVAFIGSDNYTRSTHTAIQMWGVLGKLVVEEGANIFLFNNANFFDNDCLLIVSQLKMHHPHIERHYHHGVFDYDIGYVEYMKEKYDKVFFPRIGFPLREHLRNRQMIDKCDVLITYCNNDELLSEQKSQTVRAIEYAQEKKKRVINLRCDSVD